MSVQAGIVLGTADETEMDGRDSEERCVIACAGESADVQEERLRRPGYDRGGNRRGVGCRQVIAAMAWRVRPSP